MALLSVFYILRFVRSGAPKPFLDNFHSFCPCRLVLFALLVAFYIVVAVAVAQTTNFGTQHVAAGTVWKCIPHPSWAWWLVWPLPSAIQHYGACYRRCRMHALLQVCA